MNFQTSCFLLVLLCGCILAQTTTDTDTGSSSGSGSGNCQCETGINLTYDAPSSTRSVIHNLGTSIFGFFIPELEKLLKNPKLANNPNLKKFEDGVDGLVKATNNVTLGSDADVYKFFIDVILPALKGIADSGSNLKEVLGDSDVDLDGTLALIPSLTGSIGKVDEPDCPCARKPTTGGFFFG